MSRLAAQGRAAPIVSLGVALAAWLAAFVCSSHLPWPVGADGDHPLLDRVVGGLRGGLGAHFFAVADRYYHRGVEHHREIAFERSWFQRLTNRLVPSGHLHLDPSDTRAIMPWLRFATQLDPGNVDAYLTVVHWLRNGLGRADLAYTVLREALSHNPRSPAVRLELGRWYLASGDPGRAAQAIETGLRVWPGDADPASEDARHERASLLLYRAWLREAIGERVAAAEDLETIVGLFPGRYALQEAARRLRNGEAGLRMTGDDLNRHTRVLSADGPTHGAAADAALEHPH